MGLVTSNDQRDAQTKKRKRKVVVVRSPVKDTISGAGGELRKPAPVPIRSENAPRPAPKPATPTQQAAAKKLIGAYKTSPSERDPVAQFLGKVAGGAQAEAKATHTSKQQASIASFLQPAGKVATVVAGETIPRAAGQLGKTAAQAIPGLARAAYPAAADAYSYEKNLLTGHGDRPIAPRSRSFYPALGKGTVQAVKQDVLHPRENPGYLFIDALTAASLGAGAAERAGTLGRTAAETSRSLKAAESGTVSLDSLKALGGSGVAPRGGAVKAVTRPVRALGAGVKAAATKPAPTEFPLTQKTSAGQVTVNRLLSPNPAVRLVQTWANKVRQAKLDNPTRSVRLGAPTRQELIDRYGMKPGTAGLIEKIVTPQARIGQFVSKHFGPEATVARELRAGERVDSAIANAPVAELRHAAGPPRSETPQLERLPKRLRKGISRHENKAIQALSIYGDAAVQNPARTVGQSIATHRGFAADAAAAEEELTASLRTLADEARQAELSGSADEVAHLHQRIAETKTRLEEVASLRARHELQVSDFAGAIPALERLRNGTASPAFKESARLTRELADRRKGLLMGYGQLDPSSAAFREAAPAAVSRGEPLTTEVRTVATRLERSPEIKRLDAQITDVEKEVARLTEQYRRSAKRQRPRTLGEAKARLAELEKRHEELVKTFEKSLMSHPISGEEAAAEIARIDAKAAQVTASRDAATAKLHALQADVKAGVDHNTLAQRYGYRAHTGALAGGTYGSEWTGRIAAAAKPLKALASERKRYVEAQKTGRLRVVHDASETARRNLMRANGVKVPTLAEELRAEALRTIEAAKQRHPEHPSFKRHTAEQAQIARLTEGLARADPIFGEGLTTPAPARAAAPEFGAHADRVAEIDAELKQLEASAPATGPHGTPLLTPAASRRYQLLQQEKRTLEQGPAGVPAARARGDAEARTHYFGTVPVGADEVARTRLGALLEYKTTLEDKLNTELGKRPLPIEHLADVVVQKRRELNAVPGAFRTPLRAAKARQKVASPFVVTQPSEYGVPLPKPGRRDAALTHDFTGGEIVSGDMTTDPVTAMIDSYLKGTQVVSNLQSFRDLWARSHPARLHEGMVPIRNVADVPDFLKRARRRADRNLPITREEIAGLEAGDLGALRSYVAQPMRASDGTPLYRGSGTDLNLDVPLGWKDPNGEIRWVDERAFERYGNTKLPEPVRAAFDSINNPARGLLIYAKGGYVLNLPSNWVIQGMTQGALAPAMYRRAFTYQPDFVQQLVKEGVPRAEAEAKVSRLAASIEGVVGEGKARAYAVDTGVGHKALGALASFWSSFIDRHSRVSSLMYHAHRKGINVDDFHALDRLMHSPHPKMRDLRVNVVRRANRDMVDFTSLTPIERNIVRHVLFVYPWVSRATVWAARTLLDHPYKSFTLTQLARIGEQRQRAEFGMLPEYQQQSGDLMTKIGGKPYRIGTAAISPLVTAPQTLGELKGLVTGPTAAGGQDPAEALSPAASIMLDAIRGAQRQGGKGGLVAGTSSFLRSLPQAQALRRAGINKVGGVSLGPAPNPRKPLAQQPVLSHTGLGPALGYFGLGTAFPQQENLPAAHARAIEEHFQSLPPIERAVAREQHQQSGWVAKARSRGLLKQGETFASDPELKRALDDRYLLARGYGKRAQELGVSLNRLTVADRIGVEVEVLRQRGIVTQNDVDELTRELPKMKPSRVKSTQHFILYTMFKQKRVAELKQVIGP